MLTVVSSIPISCASAYCTVKADVVKIAVASNVAAIIIIKNTFDTLFEAYHYTASYIILFKKDKKIVIVDGFEFPSFTQINEVAFETEVIANNAKQCPVCSKMLAYSKKDYFLNYLTRFS